MVSKEHTRFALAHQFFDLATGASPAVVRASLSRLYYANYHLAVLLTGGTSHGDIAKRLGHDSPGLGAAYKRMHDIRSKMDYAPDEFNRMQRAEFRLFYEEEMRHGMKLFEELNERVASLGDDMYDR